MSEVFHRPRTIADALRLKKLLGSRAIFLAGGTFANSLDFAGHPEQWISLEGLKLDRITFNTKGDAVLGACCTLQQLCDEARIPRGLKEAIAQVLSRSIRNAATIGGHLAARLPQSDLLPMLVALDARLVLWQGGASHTMPVSEYLATGHPARGVGREGLIVRVIIPGTARRRRTACLNLRDSAHARSLLSVAVSLLPVRGKVSEPIIALSGLDGPVTRLERAEQALADRPLPEIDELQRVISEGLKPAATPYAGADYLKYEAGALAALALERAFRGTEVRS
jgi:putative selenate reductase FAD-binding subunit